MARSLHGLPPSLLSNRQENSVQSKKLVKLMFAAAALAGVAQAQAQTAAPAPAPEPASSLSYNIGLVTEYRYRGISQSARQPALQGGIDYADKSGWYIGTWASTIKWIKDSSFPGANARARWRSTSTA